MATLAVIAFVAVADLLLIPLHRRGVAQPLLGPLNGLSRTLQLPGLVVIQAGRPWRFREYLTLSYWATLSGCLFAFYFPLFLALGAANRLVRRRLRSEASDSVPPEDGASPHASESLAARPGAAFSRRRLLRVTRSAVVGGAVAGLGYSVVWAPRHFVVRRRTLSLPGLPPSLDGLRIVQLTDVHLGPWISEGYVHRIVSAANALAPDLVVLTGDYVLHSPAYVAPVAGILSGLRAKVGLVGVLGNHDWREGGPAAKQALASAGVRLVDNARLFVNAARRLAPELEDPHGLCVAGVGDLWTDRQFYDRALGGVPASVPRLLLSHNPDVAEERAFVASGFRVDLMLSGHTHGGQVYVPGMGTPVVPSMYGQKYASGLVQGPACPVFVSCGLGTAMLPVRMGVPPEIVAFELKRAAAAD